MVPGEQFPPSRSESPSAEHGPSSRANPLPDPEGPANDPADSPLSPGAPVGPSDTQWHEASGHTTEDAARAVEPRTSEHTVANAVPRPIRVGAAVSWRLLLLAGTLALLGWVLAYLSVVTLPMAIALLLSALLTPVVGQLVRWRWPRVLATTVTVVAGLLVIGGALTGVIMAFLSGFPKLQTQVERSAAQLNDWLRTGPLNLQQAQLDETVNRGLQAISQHQQEITSGALSTASSLGEGLTGGLLTLVALICFLHHGDQIWRFLIKSVPAHVRENFDRAGRSGFASLVTYVRASLVVAVAEAVVVGAVLAIMGVPLVIPLASLVFLGALVPIVGAVVAGVLAVAVALVSNGVLAGIIVLAVVIIVQQLEGPVAKPLLLGRRVQLHPLAVVLGIVIGAVVAGVAGALLSLPLLTVLNASIRSLLHDRQHPADHTREKADTAGG